MYLYLYLYLYLSLSLSLYIHIKTHRKVSRIAEWHYKLLRQDCARRARASRFVCGSQTAELCALDDGAEGVQRPVQTRNCVCIRGLTRVNPVRLQRRGGRALRA